MIVPLRKRQFLRLIVFFVGLAAFSVSDWRPVQSASSTSPQDFPGAVKRSAPADRFDQPVARSLTEKKSGAAKDRKESYGNLPLVFEPNRGQADPNVRFLGRGTGYTVFLTNTEAVLVFTKAAKPRDRDRRNDRLTRSDSSDTRATSLRLKLSEASKDVSIDGADLLGGTSNYILGNDRSKWKTNIPQYRKVQYRGARPGVDVTYYGFDSRLEYDIKVAPGFDPAKVKLDFEGSEKLQIDKAGDLIVHTPAGKLKQLRPVAYQIVDGEKKIVECRYGLLSEKSFGFSLGSYDRSKELVIDPIVDYSTFIGGAGADYVNDIAVDSAGNAFLTGSTTSTDFPTTSGAFRTANVGAEDVFITKLNSTGSAILYSTYIGGTVRQNYTGSDIGNSIAIDSSGNAYVSGVTASSNFPLLNPRQSAHGGGSDAFVLKLNPTGNALIYSTYHGGAGADSSSGIAIDSAGNAYLSGTTMSANFPILNAYQTTIGTYTCQGCQPTPTNDAFVSKLSSSGTLVYSTYLGTNVWDDYGNNIAVDSAGYAYIVGDTNAQDFPTVSAFISSKPTYNGQYAFITKLNLTGNGLVYSSYLGATNPYFCLFCSYPVFDTIAQDVAVDATGSAYIVGSTDASNFPVVNAFQPTNPNSSFFNFECTNDAFLTKVSPAGTSLAYSTYLGGTLDEYAYGVSVDGSGNAHITGLTYSTNFPLVNALQSSRSGLTSDAFVAKFNPIGNGVSYSTYWGSDGNDQGNAIASDSQGNAYVAGTTESTNFSTPSSYQTINKGGSDGFVTRIVAGTGWGISGRVTKPDGSSASDVAVKLTGRLNLTTFTDQSGNYSFVNLPPNANYTVAPFQGAFSFVPSSRTFTNLSANQTGADFVIETYSIGGQVTDVNGVMSGVLMTLSGSENRTALTDSNGNYSFANLPIGNYTVTPSKTDRIVTYTFTPTSRVFKNLTSSQTANFVGATSITTELAPAADAYVQDGIGANTNFGAQTTLKVETDSKANNGKNFDSYFKFDLSGLSRTIRTAKLRISAASSTTGTVTTAAYSVTSVNWVENAITWNNKPARNSTALPGSSLGVTGTTATVYEIDVTDYVRGEKVAGRNLVSLALHNPTASTAFITANSKENAVNKPSLIVTTTGYDNNSPVVAITGPGEGSVFPASANITVSATATDSDGSISRVEFYAGTSLIGSVGTPSSGNVYSINWSNVPTGSYVLTAIAFDDNGAQTVSSPVSIAVGPANSPPSVSLSSPQDNSTFGAGSSISMSATATDQDGTISKVEFYVGTTLVGIATTPSSGNIFTAVWNNVPTGVHALTAKATDNSLGAATSAPVSVNVVGQLGLSPVADAYVQDGSSAATNFGTATELRSQLSPTSGSSRETYLKFDIASATGINKAVLRLYGGLSDTSGINVPLRVYGVTTTTWIESGSGSITWNNKPVAGSTALASITVPDNATRWFDLDLTSYVQAEKSAGRNTISIVIKGDAVSAPFVRFNSREAVSNQPQLVMLTTQPRDVLLVVGSTTLNAGDNAIKTRLQNLGFSVTSKAAGSTQNTSIKATDADGKALVLVSSTVNAANVAAKLRNVPVPVLNWEFDLVDDFGLTNTVSGTDFGSAATQTQVSVITQNHPMSAGLSGTTTVATAASAFNWGRPNSNAVQIASLTADATRFAIYGYDVGMQMFGLESPSRRVAFFFSDATGASLTPEGGALFDAAVTWATKLNLSPTILELTPGTGAFGSSVLISGINFGATQGTSTVTFNGLSSAVSNWSDTGINTVVPQGASSGPVIVTVSGISSNSIIFTVQNSNNDSDGDGLPDSWEMACFGHLNYGAYDDPDGDGINNLQEYLQGRNPTQGTISNSGAVNLKVYTPLQP